MKHFFSCVFLALLLSSCAYLERFQQPKQINLDSLNEGAKLDLKQFFSGDIEGFAIVKNSLDEIVETQIVKMNGKWNNNKGILTQEITRSDGSSDSRTWLITLNSDGTFDAVGHDVYGMAVGKQNGNSAYMKYLIITQKEKINFLDKIYLVDSKSAIMISKFSRKSGDSGLAIISLKKL